LEVYQRKGFLGHQQVFRVEGSTAYAAKGDLTLIEEGIH